MGRTASSNCVTASFATRKGVTRLLFYANRAHMGTYREAVDGFLNGSDTAKYGVTAPTITLHEHFGALKYGFGYNTEQEVTENLRVFGRFGWNEGQHESFAYTEVDQTVEARRRLLREPAGAGRWTRSAWPSSRTPSSATTRSI